jgi:hypothetical protein
MSQALHIKGARIWDGDDAVERDLYVQNRRIVSEKPNHALEVNLEGYTLFPGLINAHDHLELNHFPRTKFREVYDNAHQWGEDVNARLDDEPFKTLRNYPLWDRVFIGGLKNLLCGATTVVHHGAPHKPMFRKDFPVRVLKNYGWAHSLYFSTELEILRSYQNTPKEWFWFIHLAEGIDNVAKSEPKRLSQLGCKGGNVVHIHATALSASDVIHEAWGKIVWCPSSNYYLFGEEAHKQDQIILNFHWWVVHVEYPLLGSDSRLTANGDLLDEIRYATATYAKYLGDETDHVMGSVYANLEWMYPQWFNDVLPPDFMILPTTFDIDELLCSLSRKDLLGVIFDGIPQIGDANVMAKFPFVQTVACTLDGVEKRMNVELARQVHRCRLKEQGLEVDELPQGKRFIFF